MIDFVVFLNKVLNIGDRAYVNLSLNSVDIESTRLGNCQFFTYVTIRPICVDLILVTHCTSPKENIL